MPGKHGEDAVLKTQALFISKAINKHGDKYEYNKVSYTNSRTPVIIVCKSHGEYRQSPDAHLAGRGCKSCAMRSTTVEFIEKAKKTHGEKYDYSESVYTTMQDMITVRCYTHGYFTQNANSHISGNGCKECSKATIGNALRMTLDQFIEKARLKHGDKYDYSKVVYKNNSTKVIISCTSHGEFEQAPANHFISDGCPICSKLAVSEEYKKYTYGQFIEESKELNADRYEYDLTIDITCKKHGVFNQQVNLHIGGANCPRCAAVERNELNRYSIEDFIRLAKEVHGDIYDYSESTYTNSTAKTKIICKKCKKTFSQSAASHLRGTGCGFCNKGVRNTEEFIEKAKAIHGDKYDYTKTKYTRNTDNIIITCSLSKEDFYQRPANHLRADRGCPCCLVKRQSKGQQQWLTFLSVSLKNLQHGLNGKEYKIESTPYYADGYNLETNKVYEFNGCYWHGCSVCFQPDEKNKHSGVLYKDLKDKTLKRMELILSKGYKYDSVWECDWYRGCKAVKKIQYLWRTKLKNRTPKTSA